MKPSLTIYFATMTGNAESLAQRACDRAVAEGWDARTENLANVKAAALGQVNLALFIVSTWGDGEPPADASDFHYELERADSLALGGLRYAVFGLGDKDYADFNAFARRLDERLAALGAVSLQARVEADLDFDDTYSAWENTVFPRLAEAARSAAA
jgi:Sulfite reductase, alpha subunit (flavoprotein)